MALFDWLKKNKSKNDQVKVTKVKEDSVQQGAMAAGNPTAAARTLSRMMDQKKSPTKILVVEEGSYSRPMINYALKMAQRLDCEIVALDVTAEPLQHTGERQEQQMARFFDTAERNVSSFLEEAGEMGIKIDHVMKIGERERVISELSAKDAGIRYVLSEPDPAMVAAAEGQVQIPVFDLACSRL